MMSLLYLSSFAIGSRVDLELALQLELKSHGTRTEHVTGGRITSTSAGSLHSFIV